MVVAEGFEVGLVGETAEIHFFVFTFSPVQAYLPGATECVFQLYNSSILCRWDSDPSKEV